MSMNGITNLSKDYQDKKKYLHLVQSCLGGFYFGTCHALCNNAKLIIGKLFDNIVDLRVLFVIEIYKHNRRDIEFELLEL